MLWCLSGRCIHCRKRHELRLDGTPLSRASLEHIIPRNHGGTDRAENLGIACEGCNAAKGRKLDCRSKNDPDLARVIEILQGQRKRRWRQPPDELDLPAPPPGWSDDTD